MDLSETSVVCAITIEWSNSQGVSTRKVNYKLATIRLIRNEIREIFVEINNEKSSPTKLKMKGIVLHKKFMAEGKSTIKFPEENCTVYLSNAPPGPLILFLRTIYVKLSNENTLVNKNIGAHVLSKKANSFEEISPITNAELTRTKNASKATTTTPSPPKTSNKRRFDGTNCSANVPAAKKLYTSSTSSSSSSATSNFQFDNIEKLNEEQNMILQTCLRGKNIFFTGSAGTGKSFLLRKIISTFPPDGTTATASTGVAACLIGGVTLHSFAGVGDGEGTLTRCYDLASRGTTATNWRRCKRLIIDEVSMIDGKFFEKIEAVARYVRRSEKPFGGIQLILCGDFLQLPPVISKSSRDTNTKYGPTPTSNQDNKRFCFQSPAWEKCIESSFELKQVHRQKDTNFVRILNYLRIGHVTQEITDRLLATGQQQIESDGILATQLCSHTNDANSINEAKLDALEGETKTFDAQDSDPNSKKVLDLQVPAPPKLILKIGAQVMLLKNINLSSGLVNGARGVLIKYSEGLPVIKFKNKNEYIAKPEKWVIKTASGAIVSRKQVPLKLAWAFSIHKSQGLTLDCVEMSLSKVFEAGQAYVALSRAQSLESLRVLDFDPKQVWANPDVLQYYKQFRRELHSVDYVALGAKKKTANGENKSSLMNKIKKSLMSKPLVNIS